jgi:predicted transcriptional regulator
MKALLVQLDDPTYQALNQIAPAKKRQRSQFIREAIKKAIRAAEFAQMRAAYETNPDSEDEADDWSDAEEYKP